MKLQIETAKDLYGEKHANVLPDSINIEFSNFRIHFNFYPVSIWGNFRLESFHFSLDSKELQFFNPWFDMIIVKRDYESTQA